MTRLTAPFDPEAMPLGMRRLPRNAKGYPYGANAMFYDLVSLLSQFKPWPEDYYAFVNLEADSVPKGSLALVAPAEPRPVDPPPPAEGEPAPLV